ncbi:MAG: endonuclease domain-containing protein [Bacteroidales bacterium]
MDKHQNKLPLHAGARSKLFENAKQLRSDATKAEEVLWERLRNRSFMNLKFRRQHPLHKFVVDFYCHELKLIVEADGGYHNEPEQFKLDKSRTAELENLGYTVTRFTNREIIDGVDAVLSELEDVVEEIRQP